MTYTPYKERGHVNGATYELVQKLPDGTERFIRFNEHVLAPGELGVRGTEWQDRLVTK